MKIVVMMTTLKIEVMMRILKIVVMMTNCRVRHKLQSVPAVVV